MKTDIAEVGKVCAEENGITPEQRQALREVVDKSTVVPTDAQQVSTDAASPSFSALKATIYFGFLTHVLW